MNAPTDNHYTQQAFADTYGFTYDQVRRFKKDERLVMQGRWVLGEESIKRIAETQSTKSITQDIFDDPIGDDISNDQDTEAGDEDVNYKTLFLESRARKESALADKAELENRQKRGELVEMSDVCKMMAGRTRSFRDGLLLTSQRMAPVLAGMTDVKAIELELDNEHRYLLEQWSKEPLL